MKKKNKKKKNRKGSEPGKSQTSSQYSKEMTRGAVIEKNPNKEVSSAFDEFSDRVE